MKIRAFITHKKAEHFIDCQDRFSINPDTKSVAVSDGMSLSWQQKIWAQLLVETFCRNIEWVPTHDSVHELSPIWRSKVEAYIQSLKDQHAKENLIFRNERNLAERKSAGATLVGIRFDESNNWNCDVLGDSCLIGKMGNEYIFGTSQDTEKFDNHPDYFDSDSNKQGRGTFKKISGVLSSSNPFVLLVSDPFSDYLLEHKKNGDIDTLVNELLTINTHEEFETIVAKWRKLGMHNDDSTLLIMEYDGAAEWIILHQDDLEEMTQRELNPSQVPMSGGQEEASKTTTNETIENSIVTEADFCSTLTQIGLEKLCRLGFGELICYSKRKRKVEKLLKKISSDLYTNYKIYKK